MFLKISLNSQENTCVGVSFSIKLQVLDLQIHWKRDTSTQMSLDVPDYFENLIWWVTWFVKWYGTSFNEICGLTWCIFVHHLPYHKNYTWYTYFKLWIFFRKFCMLSIKFNYAAPFFLLRLVQSCFHSSASSFDIFSISSRDVFDPVKCKALFLFCDCLSLSFIDTSLSILQCFSSSKFLLSSSRPKPLLAFESSSG